MFSQSLEIQRSKRSAPSTQLFDDLKAHERAQQAANSKQLSQRSSLYILYSLCNKSVGVLYGRVLNIQLLCAADDSTAQPRSRWFI